MRNLEEIIKLNNKSKTFLPKVKALSGNGNNLKIKPVNNKLNNSSSNRSSSNSNNSNTNNNNNNSNKSNQLPKIYFNFITSQIQIDFKTRICQTRYILIMLLIIKIF